MSETRGDALLIDTEEFLVDPHPAYARMREAAASHRVRDPSGLEFWLVTRYDEVRAALTDKRLSKDPRNAWEPLRRAGRVAGEPADAQLNMLLRDPPDHTRLRGLVTVRLRRWSSGCSCPRSRTRSSA